MAGGLTLKDHPEFEAKGFYMRRHPTYDEPKTVHFRLDDQSDKIVWAAKYPFATPEIHETFINYEAMTPVRDLFERRFRRDGQHACGDSGLHERQMVPAGTGRSRQILPDGSLRLLKYHDKNGQKRLRVLY